jgi:hypothetical protein
MTFSLHPSRPLGPSVPRVTAARVAIFEVLERLDGHVEAHNVSARIKRLSPRPAWRSPAAVAVTLRGMEAEGWVALTQVKVGQNAGHDVYRIVEAVLVDLPPKFRGAIDDLRSARHVAVTGRHLRMPPEAPKATPELPRTPELFSPGRMARPAPPPRERALDPADHEVDPRDRIIVRLKRDLAEAQSTIDALRAAIKGLVG